MYNECVDDPFSIVISRVQTSNQKIVLPPTTRSALPSSGTSIKADNATSFYVGAMQQVF
jgi:hypothetical protein